MPMTTWLPLVGNNAVISGTGEPSGMAGALFDTLRRPPLQRRPTVVWDSRLAQAAQDHCEDMVRRGYFSHTTPEGIEANKRARLAGYDVPDWFKDDRNNIESIGAGYETVGELWQAWLKSPLHRLHVLGEESYRDQTYVGTGFFALVGAPLFDVCWAMVSCLPEAL